MKPVTEASLDKREAERDCYRQLAQATEMDRRNGGRRIDTARVIPINLRTGCQGLSCRQGRDACTDRCGAEQAACDDLPNLSPWTRARLAWTRILAGLRRR